MQSERPARRRSSPTDRAGRRPGGSGPTRDDGPRRGPGRNGSGRSGPDDGARRRKPSPTGADRRNGDGRRPSGGRDAGGDGGRDGRGRDSRGRDGRGRDGRGRDGSGREGRGRDDGGRDGRRDYRRAEYEEAPLTEAQRRSIEVRRRRGPRPELDEDHERNKIESRTVEQWIDEGADISSPTLRPNRRTSGQARPRRDTGEIAPAVIAAIADAAGPSRAPVLIERLGKAAGALDRERFGDAKRMVTPLLKEIPSVAAVQEVAGLIAYGQGRWRDAGRHLSAARGIDEDVALLPVLADVYRAMHQWDAVEQIWADIRHASPDPAVMAEGRIVAASALADRGKIHAGIRMLESAAKPPKRIRDHHLRQWYVLGDLYDRAGDQLAATGWFRLVEGQDPSFADVSDRLRQLGR